MQGQINSDDENKYKNKDEVERSTKKLPPPPPDKILKLSCFEGYILNQLGTKVGRFPGKDCAPEVDRQTFGCGKLRCVLPLL
mmetsp:Transcript_23502/g.49235  ORF Transcript_23502/g.49235 Transcript_23502/m.49235 type:complete len:82 (+) Transcript_23502:2714-2959(+)